MPATLRDVAQACAVDVSTVSRALRGDLRVSADTAARVRSAADRLGYRPNLAARALQAGATRTVWFLSASIEGINERRLAAEAAVVLETEGYDLLHACYRDDAAIYERLLGRLDQGLADAALIVGGTGVHPESPVLRTLLARQFPLVFLDRSPGWPGVPTVTTDNAGAAATLVRRLHADGARRIVCCDTDVNDVASARRSAALATATELGIDGRVAADADPAWLAGGHGACGVIASAQQTIHRFCTGHAEAVRAAELRFGAFDAWDGEPYPAPVAWVVEQDFTGMAHRAAERVLAAVADRAAWSPDTDRLPPLAVRAVRARL